MSTGTTREDAAIETEGLARSFGDLAAVDGIDLAVVGGELRFPGLHPTRSRAGRGAAAIGRRSETRGEYVSPQS